MKKRNKKHKRIEPSVPMLINREIHKNVETMTENMIILSFRTGFATRKHYDDLVTIANMMNISNQIKPSKGALLLKDQANALALSAYSRYKRVGKFGFSGEEQQQLKRFIGAYDLYWKQQTTTHYNHCVAELNLYYADLKKQREAA